MAVGGLAELFTQGFVGVVCPFHEVRNRPTRAAVARGAADGAAVAEPKAAARRKLS